MTGPRKHLPTKTSRSTLVLLPPLLLLVPATSTPRRWVASLNRCGHSIRPLAVSCSGTPRRLMVSSWFGRGLSRTTLTFRCLGIQRTDVSTSRSRTHLAEILDPHPRRSHPPPLPRPPNPRPHPPPLNRPRRQLPLNRPRRQLLLSRLRRQLRHLLPAVAVAR